jgi:hypothetical protein
MLRRLCAFLVALTPLPGCSFAFVHGPPPGHEQLTAFDCSTSNALPVLDALWAGLSAAETVAAATGSPEFKSPKTESFIYAGEAAVAAASAVYGFRKTSECREAQALLMKRAASQPAMPAFAPAPRVPNAPAPIDPWTGRPVGAPPPPPPAP